MPWLLLVVAGFLEVVWAVALEASDGFSRLVPSVITVVGLAASMWLLALATRSLSIGTAYPVWVGIGAVGTALYGVVRGGEAATPARIALFLVLVGAIVGLKLTSPAR